MFGLRSARGQIIAALVLFLVLLIAISVVAVWSAHDHQSRLHSLEHRSQAASALESARSNLYLESVGVMAAAFLPEPRLVETTALGRAGLHEDLAEAQTALEAVGDAEALLLLDEVIADAGEMERTLDQALPIAQAGGTTAAMRGAGPVISTVERAVLRLQELADEQRAAFDSEQGAASSAARMTLWVLIALSGAAFLVAVGRAVSLIFSVVRPLVAVRASVRAIASGDLEARAEVTGPEEIASLARDFNEMTDALLAKTEEYVATANLTGDIVARADAEGRWIFLNDAACQFFGKPREELLGIDARATLHPEDLEPTIQAVEKARDRKELITGFVNRQVTPMGMRVVEWNACPFFDGEGQYIGIQMTGRDITERRQAEEALRESEEKYRRLVEDSLDGIVIIESGEIKFVNRAILSIFGFESADEVVGRPFVEFISPEYRELVTERARLREKGEDVPSRYEFKGVRKDGSEFDVEVSVSTITYQGRAASQAVIRDITERKRAERALRESEERFRQVAETAREWIWELDGEMRYVYCSPAVKDILGYEPEEMIGKHPLKFTFVEDREHVLSEGRKILAKKGSFLRDTVRKVHKDGHIVVVETTGAPIFDGQGNVVGYRGVEQDVTERKRAEEALRESEERFRILFEYAPDGYYLNDLQGNFVDGNKAAEEIVGYPREELIGRNMLKLNLLLPEEVPKAAAALAENLKGKSVGPNEFTLIRKDGSRLPTEIRSYPVKIKDQTLVLGMARDISERKKTEEQLARQRAVLNMINRVLREALTCQTDEDVARACIEAAQELTGSKFGFIGEINQAGRLDTVAMTDPGWDACRIPRTNAVRMINDMEIRGIWGRVMKDGQPVIANDPASHPDRVGTPEGHPPLISFLGVPLKDGDQTIGMIALANKESGYTVADQENVEVVSRAFVEALHRKRAEKALRESEERYRLLAENASDVIWTLDMNLRYTYVSPAITRMRGYSVEEIMGATVQETLTPASLEVATRAFAEELAREREEEADPSRWRALELEMYCKDGSTIWTEIATTFLRDADGRPIGVMGITRDISERKKAEEEIRRRNQELAVFLEMSRAVAGAMEVDELVEKALDGLMKVLPQADPFLLLVYDRDKDVLEVKAARGANANIYLQVAIRPGEGIAGKTFQSGKTALYSSRQEIRAALGDLSPTTVELSRAAIEGAGPAQSVICCPLVTDGRVLGVLTAASATADARLGQAEAALLEAAADHIAVALYKAQMHTELEKRAITDSLTGLYDHAHFYQRLAEEIDRANRYNHGFAVVMLDVDNFKHYNDTHGHQVGDEMLCLVAGCIEAGLRRSDAAFRYGGDEFAAILPHADAAKAWAVVKRINGRIAKKLKQMDGDAAARLSLSAGVACFPDDGATADDLVRIADAALYSAKWVARARDIMGQREDIQSLISALVGRRMGAEVRPDGTELRPEALHERQARLISSVASSIAVGLMNAGVPQALEDPDLQVLAVVGAAAEIKDRHIRGHPERVSERTAALAEKMGLPPERVRDIRVAGLLHDIGKVTVSEGILNKPGKLTKREFASIKDHPIVGAALVSQVRGFERIVPMIRHHHERLDGRGYPDGLAGEDIPLEARMLSVVDVFDAMTHQRSYRKALSRAEAIAELQSGVGTRFDPAVVEAFVALLKRERYELPVPAGAASGDGGPAAAKVASRGKNDGG
ncbi:MAG: PAS domain S-box protein [Dehalococcoidia bacterium]